MRELDLWKVTARSQGREIERKVRASHRRAALQEMDDLVREGNLLSTESPVVFFAQKMPTKAGRKHRA